MFVPNSVYCSSSRQTSLPIYLRIQLCILFQQQADVITNICSYPTLHTVLVAGRRHYQYMFVSNSVYCSSSRQTSLPIYVRIQLCILFQQQADVITNICSYPTVYYSSSRQTSLPIYVRTQLCILFQQQADVITNICPYPTLHTVLVAGRRHYQYMFVSNSAYCSSSRQTSLPIYVRIQLCILFQQQADVITNICPYATLYTVLVAGRRHYQYMTVSNSVYCSSSRQTSLPMCVRTQLCVLFQQQAEVITIVCPYPTLYAVLVACTRHYHCVSVSNSVYCSSSRQTSLPMCVRTQLSILFQQQADVITNICPYPTLHTILVAGRRHYQCMSVPNSVYCSSSRQTSLPIYVRTQLCILFQQQADVITIVFPYPTLYTILVAGRRHYQCVFVPNSVYCSSSRQTSLPIYVRTQLCILFQQQADVITNICLYPTLYTILVAGRRHYQYMFLPNSVYCSSSRQTSLPIYVRTLLCILFQKQADVITNICSCPTLYTVLVAGRRHYQCILFQQQADVITNICSYPTLHTILVAGRRHYQYMSVPNSVYCSSSRQTSLPIYVRTQLCILFQQQADVTTNICSYPTLYTVLVAGRRHYQYMFVPNSVYCSSNRQTSLPIYVRTQLCILFQQQADVITNICLYPTLHTVLVAGRRHYQYMSVPNPVYYSSSRQTSLPIYVRIQLCILFQQQAESLPIYVRTQLCILFQQQADVITNICSYPTLYTVLVAGRRHYQYMSIPNSAYCSSSRQTSLPIYVRFQLCILFQQQADVITNICPYPTLHTVLVAGRCHYQYMSVPNSVYYSSSRQTSLPIYVRTQLCILFQQQADVITNISSYPTLYTVLVAGRRHYQYMFVSNFAYCSSSRQTSLPIYVRIQLCILFQQQADVITNICSYPTLYTILVAGRRHYQYMFVSNSVYYSSSRQTSLPIYVRTQLCILFQQQADVITNICPYPTLHTVLVAGRRHYQYMFVSNSVYCSSSRQTSLPIYVRIQLCILFWQQTDVITNICSYPTLYTILVAGRRHYQYMSVPNSVYCSSSRQTSLPIYIGIQLCILFQQQADVTTNVCSYPTLCTVLVAGRGHHYCVSVPNSVCCSSSMHTSLPLCVRIQLCILFQQQADVTTNVCSYPTLYTVLVAGRRHYQYMSVPNSAYYSSSRQTSLPMYVRTQLCILFQQQADVITNICSYSTLYTVLVAGRRHYHCFSVPNSVYYSSSRQMSLPMCVRTQLCILFQQQADVITNICPYPTLHTILVAGRRHYQYMSVPNSVYYSSSRQTSLPIYVLAQLCILFQQQTDVITNVYCSSSRQTSLPIYVRTQLCILFQQQVDVITNICSYATLYTVLVAGRRHYQYMFVPNSVHCSSSRQTSLPIYVRTQLCILFQQHADVITNICSYPTLYTALVAGRRQYQCVTVPNSVCCSSSMHTSLPLCVRIQLCILFQQQADVTTNVCSYPTLYTVLVAGRRHYQYMFVPNSAYYSSSRQTSLPIYVRTQLCILFQQQADVITNICSCPTLYTVLVAGRRHYQCILFQQQADVITNICSYPTLHTILVAGRRHYQYMSVPKSVYCSSSRQTSLPIYVRTQLCILFQQQADVITNICSYPSLYTVLVAGRRHYQYMFVPNSVYCSSSRQTSLPIYVCTQLCILFQQQADVISNICPYPTLYTVLVAGRRHYQCVFVPNSVYCSSSRQTSIPMCVRTQFCILFQQQADVITNVCSYPILCTVLVAGRGHHYCVSVPNSVYCFSSRQTSIPMCVRTQLCMLFQQHAHVITIVCPYPTLYTVLVAGRRHYQCVFVPNSVYCFSSRQTSLPIYVRTQLCILFQQQADVITNICSYPTLYTALVAGRRHYQYMFVPNSAYCSSSRQTSLPIYVCTELCILFQQQADVIINICPYPTLYTVLVAGRRHYQCVFVPNSVYCSSSRQTSIPMYVRTQFCILFQQQAHVITNVCSYPIM